MFNQIIWGKNKLFFVIIFDQMNEKMIPFLRNQRQVIRQVKAKLESFQNLEHLQRKGQIFSLKEISEEVLTLLRRENCASQSELLDGTKQNSLTDLLLFFRHFGQPKKQLNCNKISFRESTDCCQFLKEIQELNGKIECKNRIIVRLNDGYQQAKELFLKQIQAKEATIRTLNLQMNKIKAQYQILHKKIQVIFNYRENQIKDILFSHQIPKYNEQNAYVQKQEQQRSQKSSCHDIKNILSIMQTRNESQSQQKQSFQRVLAEQSCQSEPQYTPTPTKVKQFSRSHLDDYKADEFPSQLIRQISFLRENQSKLLDRICERDEIIAELMKVKDKNFSFNKSYEK